MRRTKEQATETARNILWAAESLFLEKGYANVNLGEIAALAGLSRGAVHWHFKNKLGLILALRDEAQKPFLKLADNLASNRETASLEALGIMISDMLLEMQGDARQRRLVRILVHRLDLTLAVGDAKGDFSFNRQMANLLLPGFRAINNASKLPRPWTPQRSASTLGAAIVGLVVGWSLEQPGLRLTPDGATMIKSILRSWE